MKSGILFLMAAVAVGLNSASAEQLVFDTTSEEANPLVWSCDGETVRARGTGRAWCTAGRTLKRGEITIRLTPVESRSTNGWNIAGVALRAGADNFWHLAFVQAPTANGGFRGFELAECRNGKWLAQDADKLRRTRLAQTGTWDYGQTYTLTLSFDDAGVSGIVRNTAGTTLYSTAFVFDNKPVVRAGRFALTTGGAMTAEFSASGETASCEPADVAESKAKTFPPYTGKSFVPGKTDTATGFFRLRQTRSGAGWQVIDPLGRVTFLTGVDHITYGGHTCEKLGWKKLHEEVNKVKFPNKADWEMNTLERLETWGFNMLGAGCDAKLMRRGLIHTQFLSMGAGLCGGGSDPDYHICSSKANTPCTAFPNVFHPKFPQWCDWVARRRCAPNRDDPWLFGYFIDNELSWWGRGDGATGLFEATAKLPETHSAHAALLQFIEGKGFRDIKTVPREVKHEFLRLAAERYFSVTSEAIRRHDPNHLILGARFAGLGGADPVVWEVAGRFCDVVTFNCYPWADLDRNQMMTERLSGRTMADAFAARYAIVKRPMLITEWSFPALDSGLPCLYGAGQRFRTQTERTAATELMAKTMLSLPFIIGYDYFMWVDQPPLGISEAFPEDSNYGLIDLQGNAWPEITQMFTRLHRNLGKHLNAQPPVPRAAPRDERQYADGLWPKFATNADKVTFVRDGARYTVTTPGGLTAEGEIGGRTLFTSLTLDGRPLGSFNGMIRWANVWCDLGRVTDVRFRRAHGCAVLRVTGDGGRDGIRFRMTHDFVFDADRPRILCALVDVTNTGDKPLDLKEVYFRQYAPFAADRIPSGVKRVPNLWKGWLADAWIAKDGRWTGGVTRAANAVTMNYFITGGKDQHPDAIFRPTDAPLTLQPGATWNCDGAVWMVILAGLDGHDGWSRRIPQ